MLVDNLETLACTILELKAIESANTVRCARCVLKLVVDPTLNDSTFLQNPQISLPSLCSEKYSHMLLLFLANIIFIFISI